MTLLDDIKKVADGISAEVKEKGGAYTLRATIAERKAFLSRKKLSYIAKFRIVEDDKTVKFTEMLKEVGSGLSMGGNMDDMSPGFGFKKESYNTTSGTREGLIEEQSKLFGKDYSYNFDYAKVRKEIEAAAKTAGYKFAYQITPIGL
ncbi:hypothetical protein COT77_01210 [Candidatus Berkelbacteria bacterium CG10_big_fil_rev_8_21_14_0_10_41_12]|uniref:Uncharacterized protein n=1 Tax=Candidatus Berkelbacteria bacterium CG10_big_fil_rev_8_21_14_0_10_41_12 TaxID=1974513 RepID=A0A2M6WXJ6_9BACT|nr:MAG: hypothetical protein COT77_01210 [Candidatus Berkelbacteria bacterium CG10_big_fil_rev_8_21_14_0_10_41_12]